MDVESVVKGAQGGAAVANVSTAFGVAPDKAATAVDLILAALTDRVERNSLSRGGIADIVRLLGDPSAGRALSEPTQLTSPAVAQAGDRVLDVLIGNKHVSRGIAQRVAKTSEIDSETVKRMLPVIASMMIGGLQTEAPKEIDKKLAAIPGLKALLPLPGDPAPRGQHGSPAQTDGNWGNSLPQPSSGSGGGMGGASGGGVLLPLPGDDVGKTRRQNRYDDLSDVIRRGGTKTPDGGTLANVVRSILGQLFGFKNRGVIGSLTYMFVVRWLLNLGKRILSRVVLGR